METSTDGSTDAQQVLAFVRSPEAYPLQRAIILADLAAHGDVPGLRAEVLQEILRLPSDRRQAALQQLPRLDPASGPEDPRVMAALVHDDGEAPLASPPVVPLQHAPGHLALRWSEWLRRSAGLPTHYFFPGIRAWQPTLLALAGEPGIEAVAIALFDG